MARDYFMFSFYAMGIPPIDMARLKKKSLQGDTLIYYRRKTHRMVTIPVDERLRMLTDRITPNDSLYLLPILKSDNTTKAGKEYRRFYQRYRYGLAKLAKLLGDNISLTAYTPRHSWASIAYEAGVSPNIISQVYGHANTKTTYAYLANISNDHIREARRIVNNYIKINIALPKNCVAVAIDIAYFNAKRCACYVAIISVKCCFTYSLAISIFHVEVSCLSFEFAKSQLEFDLNLIQCSYF